MSITEASNGSAAAPAVGRPVAETAENVEEKSAVEDPSKEADKTAEPAKEEKAATANEDSFEMMNDNDDTTTPKKDVAKESKTEDAPVVKEKKVVEEKKAPSLKKSPPDSKAGNEKKGGKKRTWQSVAGEKKDCKHAKKVSIEGSAPVLSTSSATPITRAACLFRLCSQATIEYMSTCDITMGVLRTIQDCYDTLNPISQSSIRDELQKKLMQLLGDMNVQVVVQIMAEVNQFRDLLEEDLIRVAESNKVEQRKLRSRQSTLLNMAETSKKCSCNGMAESSQESPDNNKNDKKKSPVVVTDSFSPRKKNKKTITNPKKMAKIMKDCGREAVTSPPSSERRVPSKRARNGEAKSPYASTPIEELLGIYRAVAATKDGLKTLDRGLVDELRKRSLSRQTMSDAHFDQFKQATIDGLVAAAVREETGDITPARMEPYCDKIRSAKRGQRFDLLMLLCPKKVKVKGKEKLISVCPGDKLPTDFDPNSCSTTRVLFKITDPLVKEEHMTDDVRGNCQCGGDGRCKKCTEDEGSARAEVYNRFAVFFYVTGGVMSFYNVGGTSTLIKENLVSKLDRHYFHIVFENGYHLSCATYLVEFFRTYENGALGMTSFMKLVCDMLKVPEAFDRMVADNTIPMIVDPEQMDEFKDIWKAGLSEDDEKDIASWKADKKDRMDWLMSNANCSDSILSKSVPKVVLSYAEFFKFELFEKNLVDSLEKVTISMVQSMQSSHGGATNMAEKNDDDKAVAAVKMAEKKKDLKAKRHGKTREDDEILYCGQCGHGKYCTLSPDQEAGKAQKLFECHVCSKRAKTNESAYLERNFNKLIGRQVQSVFYTKEEIIKKMNTRCCVRGCKRSKKANCDLDGLCKVCNPKRNKGDTLTKKEFPVIPYQGRTTAGCTAAFEYQEDLVNYLEITR